MKKTFKPKGCDYRVTKIKHIQRIIAKGITCNQHIKLLDDGFDSLRDKLQKDIKEDINHFSRNIKGKDNNDEYMIGVEIEYTKHWYGEYTFDDYKIYHDYYKKLPKIIKRFFKLK